MYRLGGDSLRKLKGVDPLMVDVVTRAIEISKVDFAVMEGVRTAERQMKLHKKGSSPYLNGIQKGVTKDGILGTGLSDHQIHPGEIFGKAVDLGAYVERKISWEMDFYYEIAAAMRTAAIEKNVPIRWGCVWDGTLNDLAGPVEELVAAYVARRKAIGRKAFLDGPHFELKHRI
ncbi:MAG: hypothetical protein KUG64_11115 [Cycloclasticus sp.]|nr:hypothetical protein [Cycloclasticus sp.]